MSRLYYKALAIGLLLIQIRVAAAIEPTASSTAPDMNVLIQHAHDTQKRLQTNSAKWTFTLLITGSPTTISADWMTSPDGSSVLFSLLNGPRRTAVAHVIDRDGFWFVNEAGRFAKYLPYEAPFKRPTIPFYTAVSKLRFVDQMHEGYVFDSQNDSIATYHTPLWEPLRGQMQAILDDAADATAKLQPGATLSPRIKTLAAMAHEMIDHGVTTRVDTRTGLLTEQNLDGRLEKWSPLVWLFAPENQAIDTAAHQWADHSTGPMAVDPNDLVMMSHNGLWVPGESTADGDARIVNIQTSEVWRVPFTNGRAVPGCFLKDRNIVVVYSPDLEGSGGGLYTVNLHTRENHRLGGDALSTGVSQLPAVSHDGKTLALMHRGPGQRFTEQQVFLLDLATGNFRPIGPIGDAAYLSWRPDDSGLILMQRKPMPFEDQPDRTIVKMDLQGQVTKIMSDDAPLLLPGNRILFRESGLDPMEWNICNLDASDPKPLGDGLTDFGPPALSPDGQHLLMMRFSSDRKTPSMPNILDLDGKNPRPLAVDTGYWADPRW